MKLMLLFHSLYGIILFVVALFHTSTKISDIDECDLGIDTCHLRATCENIDGSYICECSEGYHGNGHNCRRKLDYPTISISY